MNKKTFNEYVIETILARNDFDIKAVRALEDIRTMMFVSQDYDRIVALIKNGNLEPIKAIPESLIRTSEYLSVMKFVDQRNRNYIVTVYDSDDLSQDPQVIDIFSSL
jgi:hypothetical protein